MTKTVKELKTKIQRITLGGNEEARKRHTSKKKLLARERVDLLLDPKCVPVSRCIRHVPLFAVLPFSSSHSSPAISCTAMTTFLLRV